MWERTKRMSLGISSVLSPVEPEPDLNTGSDKNVPAPQLWLWYGTQFSTVTQQGWIQTRNCYVTVGGGWLSVRELICLWQSRTRFNNFFFRVETDQIKVLKLRLSTGKTSFRRF